MPINLDDQLTVQLHMARYADNGNTCVTLYTQNGQQFWRISDNLLNKMPDGQFFLEETLIDGHPLFDRLYALSIIEPVPGGRQAADKRVTYRLAAGIVADWDAR